MSLRTKTRRRGSLHASRVLLLVLSGLAVVVSIAVQAAGGSALAAKPVIGKPVTTPLQPTAGERFTVSFRVTRSDTGVPLLRGRMICDPSVSGREIAHAESFKAGTARLSFVVPATAAGKLLKVKVTIKTTTASATKVSTFHVQGSPSITIGGASAAEGNSGTTTLSFPVELSAGATQPVSVSFATADGTAVAPSDYAAASGTLTFAKGQTTKTVEISVVADAAIEQDETFTVTLTQPVNATIATGTATGTIRNDDTSVPVTAGNYKGATQEGNFVFFVVTPNRTVTEFRINAIPCTCDGPLRLTGGEDFGDSTFTIKADGSFLAKGDWTGSNVRGDAEWLHWDATLTGQFTSATTVTGTIIENYELKYQGTLYRCTTRLLTWSAVLQG